MDDIEKNFGKKPKKKTGRIIALIIIFLIITALLFGYFVFFRSPKTVFALAMDKLVNSLELREYDTAKISMKVNMQIDSDEEYVKEMNDALKDIIIKYDEQIDLKNKQEILNIGLDYKNENAIDAQLLYNDDGMYVYLKDIFDKYIEIDLYDEFDSGFSNLNLNLDSFDKIIEIQQKQDDYIKAIKIAEKEVKKALLKEGDFSKESDTLEINGEDVKVTKNEMELTMKNLGKVIKTVSSNLSKNDKFLSLFDESPKAMLKEMGEDIDTSGTTSKDKVIVSIYTKGLLNEFVGVEFSIQTNGIKYLGLSVIKEDKDTYSFKYEYPNIISYMYGEMDLVAIEGKITIDKKEDKKDLQEGTIVIEISIPDVGKFVINEEYKVEYDIKIDKVDVKNSVKADKLTEKEIEDIVSKLSEKPLIGDIVETLYASSQLSKSAQNASEELKISMDKEALNLEIMMHKMENSEGKFDLSTFKPEGFTKNTDGTYTSENGNTFKIDENGTITIVEELTTKDPIRPIAPATNEISENEVTNYTYKVSYSVPSTFSYQSSYSSSGYKYYKSGNGEQGIDATVSIEWITDSEMIEDVKSEYDFEKQYSKNVNLSDIKTIEVNGKTFKYQTLSYEFLSVKSTEVFIWYPIDSSYIFRIDLDGYNMEPTEDIIKGFLNITVSK